MSKNDSRDEYARDRAERQRKVRKLARKRKWEDRFVNLLAGLVIVGGVIGVVILVSLLGALGVYLGWNLGVYGLAHAVHTSVGHISFWTAFGTSFAIGVVARLFSDSNKIEIKRNARS